MWYLIPTNLFPKYKIKKYHSSSNGPVWAITKRIYIFFYLPLTHTKIVQYPAGHCVSSHEILMFYTITEAKDEITRMEIGGEEAISRRTWKNGKCISEQKGEL